VLSDQLIDQALRRADGHESANHICRTLGIIATASSTETLLMLMAPMVTATNGEPFASIQKLGAG
jgi:hypothetical protein